MSFVQQKLTIADVGLIILTDMIKFFLIFFAIFGCQTGNSATYTDEIWANERANYLNLCVIHKEKLEMELSKEEGLSAESRSPATILSRVCKRDPSLCSPPRKPEELFFYEQMGKPYTQDFCLDI